MRSSKKIRRRGCTAAVESIAQARLCRSGESRRVVVVAGTRAGSGAAFRISIGC